MSKGCRNHVYVTGWLRSRRNDGVAEVFDWYFTSGDVEIHTGGSNPMTFKVSGPSAEHLRGLASGLGAVLTGRRTFDIA